MWPDHDSLRNTMSIEFRKHFGRNVAVIIDCFEIFIDRPSSALAKVQRWPSYKHHNTIEFLIGITPQGTVSFISEAWDGRVSDKMLTSYSRLLDYLLPDDIILADREFDIQDSVDLACTTAAVRIPAFAKGKDQLQPIDVEVTRKTAHVRIHVERVIGVVRQKYTILNGNIQIDFLIVKEDKVVSTIVNMCHARCALIKLSESVDHLD